MTEKTNFDAAMSAGSAIADPSFADKTPFVVAPEGWQVKSVEGMLSAPVRHRGTTNLLDAKKFCEFVSMYKNDGSTVIMANIDEKRFTAIFDFHNYETSDPGWGDFRAELSMRHTSTWKRWMAKNDVGMNQIDFADFIEANMHNIVDPAGADVMDMVSALKVKRKAEFHSVVDTGTGMQSLQFSEETKGETIKGNVDFFGRFTIGVAPFVGCIKYQVECRLRFRITEGNSLRVFYQIINPEMIEEDAFNSELESINEHMESISVPVFM